MKKQSNNSKEKKTPTTFSSLSAPAQFLQNSLHFYNFLPILKNLTPHQLHNALGFYTHNFLLTIVRDATQTYKQSTWCSTKNTAIANYIIAINLFTLETKSILVRERVTARVELTFCDNRSMFEGTL